MPGSIPGSGDRKMKSIVPISIKELKLGRQTVEQPAVLSAVMEVCTSMTENVLSLFSELTLNTCEENCQPCFGQLKKLQA